MASVMRTETSRHRKKVGKQGLDAFFIPSCEGSDYAHKLDQYVLEHSGPLTSLRTVADVDEMYVVGDPDVGGNRWLALGTTPKTPARFLIPGVLVEKHFLPIGSFQNILKNPGGAVQSAWIWHGTLMEYRKIHNGINNILAFMGEREIIDRPTVLCSCHSLDQVIKMGKRLLTPEKETFAPELDNYELNEFAEQGLLYTTEKEIHF